MTGPVLMWAAIPWVIAVLLLVWWVSRIARDVRGLLDKTEHVEFPTCPLITVNGSWPIPHKMATDQDVKSLAQVLGYEWENVPAKSGWRRRPGLAFRDEVLAKRKVDMGFYNLIAHRRAILEQNLVATPQGIISDRRKPDLAYTANAQGADGKVRKVSSKPKKRRRK